MGTTFTELEHTRILNVGMGIHIMGYRIHGFESFNTQIQKSDFFKYLDLNKFVLNKHEKLQSQHNKWFH